MIVLHQEALNHMLLAIVNPVSGHSTAASFFHQHVFPLLSQPYNVLTTQYRGHAEHYIRDLPADDPLTIILGSGDGTLHEIINAFPRRSLTFVLVPCGTANALYVSLFPQSNDHDTPEYKLQSVRAFITNATPRPLSLASTILSDSTPVLSSVVVSTSLHASILHHSEALRQSHPGIERFKIAAQQNATKWYKSRVKLHPIPSTGVVQLFDSQSNSFISHPLSALDKPVVDLSGPFVYFLSTVNVDRLEPLFRISPLSRTIPPPPASCDIVIIRPLRDPSLSEDNGSSRALFAAKTWMVLGGAYQDGAHVHFTYQPDGTVATAGDGPSVVEYIRAGGWEWVLDQQDPDAHLVCADGDILRVPDQGSAICTIDTSHRFSVYGS